MAPNNAESNFDACTSIDDVNLPLPTQTVETKAPHFIPPLPPVDPSWLSTTVRAFKILQFYVVIDINKLEKSPVIPPDRRPYLNFALHLLRQVKDSEYIKAMKVEKAHCALNVKEEEEENGNTRAEGSEDIVTDEILINDDGDTTAKDGGKGGETKLFKEDPFAALKLLESLDNLILTAMRLAMPMDPEQAIRTSRSFIKQKQECSFLLSYVQPSAAKWHTKRRTDMLRDYGKELRALHSKSDTLVTTLATLGVSFGQIFIATKLVGRGSWLVDLFLSATVGSFFAFGFQALNHILMHSRVKNVFFKKGLALIASSCSPLPWFSYYMSGGHKRHHKNAGTETDIDREALFWIWEKVPHKALDNPLGSILWVSTAALFLPLAYMYSLFICFYYVPKSNAVEMAHFISESISTFLVFYFTWHMNPCISSLTYLVLSGAFSMGFLCHPYLGFWILQHLCVLNPTNPTKSQPTVSHYGSRIWGWMNYNILLHVEHHDFSKIPWHLAGTVREIAPDYYRDLKHSDNILGLIKFWVTSRGKKMDFCCEHLFGMDFVRNN